MGFLFNRILLHVTSTGTLYGDREKRFTLLCNRTDGNRGFVIQCKLPFYMKGKISILWHCQMNEKENVNKMLVTI